MHAKIGQIPMMRAWLNHAMLISEVGLQHGVVMKQTRILSDNVLAPADYSTQFDQQYFAKQIPSQSTIHHMLGECPNSTCGPLNQTYRQRYQWRVQKTMCRYHWTDYRTLLQQQLRRRRRTRRRRTRTRTRRRNQLVIQSTNQSNFVLHLLLG